MRSAFDNLRSNPLHGYQSDNNGDKQIIKIYRNELLIAKRITIKKSIRYFAVKGFEQFLIAEVD